ncbi:MAG: 1-deoxy-D-xylulose-5-phosphate synthase [Treponema sp.]|nr:1-deoxy-D-xylulose-5-phosphate synthase [Treponema sp.]
MLLQKIHSPEDLKKIPQKQLPVLANEIRSEIIDVVGKNGGHLASNLGVVELSIILHRVFNSPSDAIVWDVSHQSYPHKLLTGRYGQFHTLRTKDGISGFTRINESPHDYFDAGHASSSISSALGLLTAWDIQGRNDKVIAVIGDGAMTGGMAFEALSHAGNLAKNLIVIVNDNQMSISRNTGALSRYLSKLTMSTGYQKLRYKIDRAVDNIPYFNRKLGYFIYRFKRGLKGLLLTNNLFVDLGFEYVGPLNGHNMQQLEETLKRVKKIPRPVVVHVVTKKGKGYSPAEDDPSAFHGVGPFNTSDGYVEKFDTLSFTEVFSREMLSLGEKNPRVVAITAAMSKGTGLDSFSRHYSKRFFDVGIAEEHAVTFAGGLAAGGLLPVVAIYSTFIQRSIDQIIEDIALQKRHVIFVFDRAGAVPSDGETHQGIFDIALLKPIPNMTMMTVCSESDLKLCLEWAVEKCKGPVSIRWPKLSCPSEIQAFSSPVEPGRGIFISCREFAPAMSIGFEETPENGDAKRKKILLVLTGSLFSECLTAARSLIIKGYEADMYVLRFLKPFDEGHFISKAKNYDLVMFLEDGVKKGGISEYLDSVIKSSPETHGLKTSVTAFPDSFVANGSRQQILESTGLSSGQITEKALSQLSDNR